MDPRIFNIFEFSIEDVAKCRINTLIGNFLERKYRKVGQEKNTVGFFFSWGCLLPYRVSRKGSKYQEFYNLLGCITCMSERPLW